jgi:outer membrane lipoprotein carrier protein
MRKKSLIAIGVVYFLLITAIVVAGGPMAAVHAAVTSNDVAALVQKLQEHYQATDSFTANFVETLSSPGTSPRTRQGTVVYRKPGLIRWEFAGTQAETIVSDGTTVFDYDRGLNQVIEMPLRSAFKNQSALAFILGVGNLERDFEIKGDPSSSANPIELALTPKSGGNKIELGVDSNTLNIVNFRVADALGNSTAIRLSEIQRNVPIEVAAFKFAPPAGADIVTPAQP